LAPEAGVPPPAPVAAVVLVADVADAVDVAPVGAPDVVCVPELDTCAAVRGVSDETPVVVDPHPAGSASAAAPRTSMLARDVPLIISDGSSPSAAALLAG
jgi:hypothetical protein